VAGGSGGSAASKFHRRVDLSLVCKSRFIKFYVNLNEIPQFNLKCKVCKILDFIWHSNVTLLN
jgi:hypothetical protein